MIFSTMIETYPHISACLIVHPPHNQISSQRFALLLICLFVVITFNLHLDHPGTCRFSPFKKGYGIDFANLYLENVACVESYRSFVHWSYTH